MLAGPTATNSSREAIDRRPRSRLLIMAWVPTESSPSLLRPGWALFWARRWRWLALTHLGLAVVLIMYFLMVLANTAGFSYSFWNEPARKRCG